MHPLICAIINQLENELATAINASEQAHSSATHSENIADNKYGTLALEAAYLAHGQSVRITELQQSIAKYKQFKRPDFSQHSSVQLGAQVDIENSLGEIQRLFIGPGAGGLCITENSQSIRVITTATPLGQALLNKNIDDDIEISINKQSQYFTITDIQ